MKRSEMLKILEQLIYDNARYDSHDHNNILTGLEQAGMSPPPRWSSTLRGDAAYTEIERLKWDSEDDHLE